MTYAKAFSTFEVQEPNRNENKSTFFSESPKLHPF